MEKERKEQTEYKWVQFRDSNLTDRDDEEGHLMTWWCSGLEGLMEDDQTSVEERKVVKSVQSVCNVSWMQHACHWSKAAIESYTKRNGRFKVCHLHVWGYSLPDEIETVFNVCFVNKLSFL